MTEASQDKTLQKKLVGAAVLIALAVIFLPMLFDGKKDEAPVSMQIKIPPKPTYDIPNRLDREQPAVAAQAPVEAPPVQTIEIATEPAAVDAKGEQQAAKASPAATVGQPPQRAAVEPPVEQKPIAKPKPPKADKKPVAKVEKPKAAKVASKPAASKPSRSAAGGAGFVVQVGSFSQKANADTLTIKLQAKGFPAFVEGTKAGGKSIYRVKVGPRPTREAADDLRQRLIDKQRLEGIIVSHH